VEVEMGAWWQGRMVAFDLETTGVDPEEARIVTAALALCGGGEPTETATWIANPGVEIPEEAANVHGITTERAEAEGRPAVEVVSAVLDALGTAPAHLPLVIFNARYDLTVLDREARRHGLLPLTDRRSLFVVDPLMIDKWLDRYRKGSRKLDAICAHYGAVLDGAHDASYDAIAAARAAWVLGAKGRVVRKTSKPEWAREAEELRAEWAAVRGDLAALDRAQRRWAREQALSLADYFRKQGQHDDADGVRVEWPVIPLDEMAAAPARV
jgi:DNA polymerase III epsilon subunit-like protein